MSDLSRIEEWTDEYLRDMCVMAVAACAAMEERTPNLSPFWLVIFREVRRRDWGDLERMEAVGIAAGSPH
ncbi:hypothetical protein I6F26_00445 [Ensifer sp. IC3342]|nr:hypothetical protein [Ensifer sp. BRP08]MCA1445063.1 hypothetical protein [Ensifer sp. IC3342]